MKKLILASKSPRRREIMKLVGMDFDVVISECDENIEYDDPRDMVSKLSYLKAKAVADTLIDGLDHLVIGSDTTVLFNGEVLGKPKDEEEAFKMLRAMSGNTHVVYTGVSIINTKSGKSETFYEETKVEFYEVSDDEINAYIATKDPMDKAGAYGVQGLGAFLVKRIEGDYFTVVGLPIAHLIQVLKNFEE